MSRSYVKGRRFEHYIKDKLEAKGWIVTRSAGSKGPFDLLAVKNGKILLIQCKWRRNTIAKNLRCSFKSWWTTSTSNTY